jgi:hypothetical protein
MRCTISELYFGKEVYMFQTDLLSIISSLNTVFTTIGVYHASYVDCLLARLGPSRPCYQTVNIRTKLVISSAVVAVRTLQMNGDFPDLAILKLIL